MITKVSVRVAVASLLSTVALAGLLAVAAPSASAETAPVAAPAAAEQVVVFDDDTRRGLDRCTVLELDNTTGCVVLPTTVLNRLVVEEGLDQPGRGSSAAEGLSASQSGLTDPRWR